METKTTTDQERIDRQNEILRQVPGFRLDTGEPCLCGVDKLRTSSRMGYSDSVVFTHRCTDCKNTFRTWIEG